MRVNLIVLLLITTLMQVGAATFAQKVTLKENGLTMERMFKEIRKQTGYDVLMRNTSLKGLKVNANFQDTPLDKVMDFLVQGTNLTYSIEEKTIVITEKSPSLLDRARAVISNIVRDLTVKGRVTDQDGKPLPNASIRVRGKSAVTNTNQDGEFEIKGVDKDAVLLVSYVGFKTLEISLKDAVMPLEIKLNVATGELEEVKVTYSTGYQNIPKERATGSFVQIDNQLFNRAVGTYVLDRILQVTNSLKTLQETGTAVSSPISIRGFSTIKANMKPLIVIDGFAYEEQRYGNQFEILLKNLNPNDIENITILRDAAAASIWGARSGNGVIVITTKKGKYNQSVDINFSSSVGIVEKPRLDKMNVISPMDAIEFEKKLFATGVFNINDDLYASLDYFPALSPAIEVMLAARKKNASTPGYNMAQDAEVQNKLAQMGKHDIRDDISKYLLQNSVTQQYAFNISGGADKMKYYVSVGYDNNLPSEKGNQDNRLTLNFNNSYKPIKNLELNTYLVYTKIKDVNNGIGYQQFLPAGYSVFAPYTALADASGNPLAVPYFYRSAYVDTASYPALLDWRYRPITEVNNNNNKTDSYSTRFGGGLKYDIISGINVAVNSQYEKELSNNNNYQNLESYNARNYINQFSYRDAAGKLNYPVPLGGILNFSNTERTSWNVRGVLGYNKTLSRHRVDAIAGAEFSQATFKYNMGKTYGYDPNTNSIISTIDYKTNFLRRASFGALGQVESGDEYGGTLNRFISYFANGAYTFNNKYTFSASGRVDASNFLGAQANQRFTPLWSSGIMWDISKEDFFKVRWLPILKLRLTYGCNGNLNNKATALPTARYNPPSGNYNQESYLTLLTPPNPGLMWERVRNINMGVDYGMINNRVSGSLEYYTKEGIDLIGDKVVEATSGIIGYSGNYANMISQGIDFRLNTINLNHQLKWQTNLNLSYNTDEITKYDVNAMNSATSYLVTSAILLNKPLLKIYSYPSAGLDPLNGNPRGYVNGEIKNFDQVLLSSSAGGATEADLIYHGSAIPTVFGNVLNTFDYKGFSLSFNIGYSFNYFVRKASVNYTTLFSNFGNGHGDYNLRWQNPGDERTTGVPSVPENDDGRSSFYKNLNVLVIKGDHIRLNDIRLGYSINKSSFKQLPFKNANIFLYSSNLGILWKANKQGVDPNLPDNSQPPISRKIALGINLNL